MSVLMTAPDLRAFLAERFPQALQAGFTIEAVSEEGVTLQLTAGDAHLRPGGTVSGPTMMMLADSAMYLSILARRGPLALAVTSSLEIHFLRKPAPGALVARCTLLKLGRRLAVGSVDLLGGGRPVARATVTYALPETADAAAPAGPSASEDGGA